MRKGGSILVVFILTVARLFSQDINVTAGFDTTSVYIGDQVYFTVEIVKPVNTQIEFPTFKDTLFEKIEIIKGPDTETIALQGGRNKIVQKYLVTSFDSGLYNVPPVFVEVKESGNVKRYYSGYSVLSVDRIRTAPQDTADVIYDIIKPYRAPLTLGEILPWFLLAALTGVIIWYMIKLLKKRKRRVNGYAEPEIIEPAHIIAFRDLGRLKDETLWQNGEVKLYYTKLTEILRKYLENRYNIMSPELTTEETLAKYKSGVKPEKGVYDSLKSILINADLVKFAKFRPVPEDNEAAFKMAWDYISITMEKIYTDDESDDGKNINQEEGK